MDLELTFKQPEEKEETFSLTNQTKELDYNMAVRYNGKLYSVTNKWLEFKNHPMGTSLIQHVVLTYLYDV